MRGDVRRRRIRSPISSLRSSAAAAAPAGRRRDAAAAAGRSRTGARRRARDRADARGRLSRRDAPAVAQARRPRPDRRRQDSGRRRRRLAGPRRRRRRAGRRRRPAPAISICASGCRRTGASSARATTSIRRVPVPLTTAVLGGEAAVHDARRQDRAAEDSADDPERPGVPAQGPRHADRSASPMRRGDLYATSRRPATDATLHRRRQRAHYEALGRQLDAERRFASRSACIEAKTP